MGLDLQEAIDRPRLHLSIRPDGSARVEYEHDPDLARAAAWSGLPVVEHGERSMFSVASERFCAGGRQPRAAADPRREAQPGVSD